MGLAGLCGVDRQPPPRGVEIARVWIGRKPALVTCGLSVAAVLASPDRLVGRLLARLLAFVVSSISLRNWLD